MFPYRRVPFQVGVTALRTRLPSASYCLTLHQPLYKALSHHWANRNSHEPLSSPNMSTEPVEEVDFTFVEEPLGLRADQGYGYLQVEFGQRIGPSNRYEILRKLGWGLNVCLALIH